MNLNASGSATGSTTSWWRPPGALDAASLSGASSCARSSSSRLVVAVNAVLNDAHASQMTPIDNLLALRRLVRAPTAEAALFSQLRPSLALRLLDVLAQQLLGVAQAAADAQSQAPFAADAHALLELLYLFARHASVGYPSPALARLLVWLVGDVVASALGGACENESTLKLELLLLAELLKLNAGVRLFVKESRKVKDFYRALTILLNSTEDAELLVFSMAVLARLVLAESLGAKLFSAKNAEQAFELAFSILDGSWTHPPRSAGRTGDDSVLSARTLLQAVSVDLLCELAGRAELLGRLEKHARLAPLVESCFMAVSLNGDAGPMQVALHLLASVAALGLPFRKLLLASLADGDVLHRVLQATLHPSKLLGILTTQLVLRVLGDDARLTRGLVLDSDAHVQRLQSVLTGLFRCVNETAALVQQQQQADDGDSLAEFALSAPYLHSVNACQLLARLCEFPAVRAACVHTVSLNQSATLIQLEAAQLGAGDPQSVLRRCQPRLALHVVILLAKLAGDPAMADKTKRTLGQFLQSADVALVLGAGVCSRDDKALVVETLLLVQRLLAEATSSSSQRFVAFGLAEGVLSFGQRVGEAAEALQAAVATLEASSAASAKTVEGLQTELQQTRRAQDAATAQQHAELEGLKGRFREQVRQQDEALAKTREAYEAKLRELGAQCEALGQLASKSAGSAQHREQLLQASRAKEALLADESAELARKVEALERRLNEVARSHAVAAEEARLRDRELRELRDELAALSSDYTAQRGELELTHECNKTLERELSDKAVAHESTYKELVLLAKAHKAALDEREEGARATEAARDQVVALEALNASLQARAHECKDLAEQLERKVVRLEDAAIVAQQALEDEREKRKAAARDVDELRKGHRAFESDLARCELRAAEQRLLLEAKDERLRQCEDEIRHLTSEVGKQVKLQALIHQLSSGGDAHAFAASSFLARDS
ncbi:hypothetical protein PybrP1_012679 [[Pythium] brassicae (nom. inval.)]|nr:hypothetical protein PybrP1_012679 [[Pythium] brassicae (nom. inval.)]